MVALTAFFLGYEMGFLPRMRTVSPTYAQDTVQYESCYTFKNEIEDYDYDKFQEGDLNEDKSIKLPPGWRPVGFTGSSNELYTLVCK